MKAPTLPCAFSGEVVRDKNGAVARSSSDQMKDRATHKEDVSASAKQLDIKGTVVVDVLVGTSGEVICVRSLVGHPLIATAVQGALRNWTFKRLNVDHNPVAYVGQLQFNLCNINCGDSGLSMTILN